MSNISAQDITKEDATKFKHGKRSRSGIEVEKPPRKRVKASLAQLTSMPLDVIFEIFGHVLPVDLLHLTRTTKEIRRMLMHPSAAYIWRATLANTPGLPPCPNDMVPPQYVDWVFGQHCQNCLAPKIRRVEWRLRVRYCPKCTKELITEHYELEIRGLDLESVVLNKLKKTGRKSFRLICVKQQVEDVKRMWESLQDDNARDSFQAERIELIKKQQEHADECEEWAKMVAENRSQDRKNIKMERKQLVVAKLTELGWGDLISKFDFRESSEFDKLKAVSEPKHLTEQRWCKLSASLVAHMERVQDRRESKRIELLKNTRKKTAIEVLRTYKNQHLPYDRILPEPADFCDFPEVKMVVDLPTDVKVDASSFARIAERLPEIVAKWTLEVHRNLIVHIRKQREQQSRTYTSHFKPILELELEDRDLQGSLETDNDERADDCLNQEIDRKMRLATTVFKCRRCSDYIVDSSLFDSVGYRRRPENPDPELEPYKDKVDFARFRAVSLFYPRILGHRCLTQTVNDGDTSYVDTDDPSLNLAEWPYSEITKRAKWSPSELVVDLRTGEVVKRIVIACELDPTTATAQDMDELDARLACLNCTKWPEESQSTKAIAPVVDWRKAAEHHAEKHGLDLVKWYKLPDRATKTVHNAEERLALEVEDTCEGNSVKEWSCVHCRDLPVRWDHESERLYTVKFHLKEKHSISDPQVNIDYYKDMDSAPNARVYGVLRRQPLQVSLKLPTRKALGFI